MEGKEKEETEVLAPGLILALDSSMTLSFFGPQFSHLHKEDVGFYPKCILSILVII